MQLEQRLVSAGGVRSVVADMFDVKVLVVTLETLCYCRVIVTVRERLLWAKIIDAKLSILSW